jgi:hypothetical protein
LWPHSFKKSDPIAMSAMGVGQSCSQSRNYYF